MANFLQFNLPVSSIVDKDTCTSMPRVADDGSIANSEHNTKVESLSATAAVVGIVNSAPAGQNREQSELSSFY